MSSLRATSALLHTYYTSSTAAGRVGARRLGGSFRVPSKAPSAFVLDEVARAAGGVRRRAATRAASWDSEKSPYETLGTTKLWPMMLVREAHGFAIMIDVSVFAFLYGMLMIDQS